MKLNQEDKFWTCNKCYDEYTVSNPPMMYGCQHPTCQSCSTQISQISGYKCSDCRTQYEHPPVKARLLMGILESLQISPIVLGKWYFILPQELRLPQLHLIQQKMYTPADQVKTIHYDNQFFEFIKTFWASPGIKNAYLQNHIDPKTLDQILVYMFRNRPGGGRRQNGDVALFSQYQRDLSLYEQYWTKIQPEHTQILESLYDTNYKNRYLRDLHVVSPQQCNKENTGLQLVLKKHNGSASNYNPKLAPIWETYMTLTCGNQEVDQVILNMTSTEPISEMQCIFWLKDQKRRVISQLSLHDKMLDERLRFHLKGSPLYDLQFTRHISDVQYSIQYKQVSGFIKLDIKNAFPSVDWKVLSDVLHKLYQRSLVANIGTLATFELLYSPKYVQIDKDTFVVNKGIFLGTKSGHKLFSILLDAVFRKVAKKIELNAVPIVVVDDILIPLDSKRFQHAEKILQIVCEKLLQFKLQINEEKTQIVSGETIQFAGKFVTANCTKQPTSGKRVLLGHHMPVPCIFCE